MNSNPLFISYASADKSIVWPFVEKLEGRLHTKCWIDKDKFQVGKDLRKTIYEGIDNCKAVLFMLSDAAIDSPYTREEIDYATGKGKKVIPILIDGKPLRGWAQDILGEIYYVDANKSDSFEILIRNIKEWYPNIGNEYYLKIARDYLAEHPKGLKYGVKYLDDLDDCYDISVSPLEREDVLCLRRCLPTKVEGLDLEKTIKKKCPEVYAKVKHPYSYFYIDKICDYDKDMTFVQCNVAVFEDGLEKEPKRLHIPVPMTLEDYEDLLAWKLEWRGRDIFSLQKAMPVLSEKIVSEIKSCRYLPGANDTISHPFAMEIDDLEKDAYDLLGERELELIVFDAREYYGGEYPVGEWFETILQIYEKHLIFGVNSDEGRYMIEVDDAIAVQNAMNATCYREIAQKFKEEFPGETGVATFKGWLEGHNIAYVFTDGDCPDRGNFYSFN